MDDPHDCDALLAQARWVRDLARHLARDPHAADDLAQEALTAAIVHPPPPGWPLKAWLGAVVRNLARHERRGSDARRSREQLSATDEAQPSSADLCERLDTHRELVEAVRRLDEPYRSAILLRYFEGLSPRAIASRSGVPLRTVHTRLHRALNRLRSDLDRAHGNDGRSWLLALLPIAREPSVSTTAAIGALMMDAKLKIGIVLVAAAAVCTTIVSWPTGTHPIAPAQVATAGTEPLAEPTQDERAATALARTAPVDDRRAQAAATEPTPAAIAPATEGARLHGRVIDVERAPVAGVTVRWFGAETGAAGQMEARTDASGRFELEPPRGRGRVDVASAGWTSLFRPEIDGASDAREVVIVVSHSVKLSGRVVDEERRGLAAATVAVPMPYGLRARFDAILDASSTVERRAVTDADGRFELDDVPVFPGARLVTTHAPHADDDRAMPELDDLGLEIRLLARDGPGRLSGKVVDPEGRPVEGARVALGDDSTKSGAGGVFVFDVPSSDNGEAHGALQGANRMCAVRAGNLPACVERTSDGAWPEPLVLRLGGEPLMIDGRVLDADGKPLRAVVWTSDETHFGYVEIEHGEMAVRAGATLEGLLREDPFSPRTKTDAGGRFAIKGLLARAYRVHVLEPKTLAATVMTLDAGTRNVEIRLPREEFHERVAGRATSLSGTPIAGLRVVLAREPEDPADGRRDGMESAPTTTDAEGRFAFEHVSHAVSTVRVSGSDIALEGFERPIRATDDVLHLDLSVPMSVHVQVDASGRADFDHVAILDAQGEKLELSIHHGSSSYGMRDVPLTEGRTEVFSVSESGVTVVLSSKGAEVTRRTVKLVHGELNTIRP